MERCNIVVTPPQYTPPWPSVRGVIRDRSFHEVLAHPGIDRSHSPMADAVVAGQLSWGRKRH